MAIDVFANNATATLAGAITNTSTTVNLQSGEGALFPTLTAGEQFVGTFTDAATGLLSEIVWCTARSGDVLTIVRAQESTTGLAWNAGDFFSQLWTAGQAAAMLQQSQVPNTSNFFGIDTGTVNAIVSTVTPALTSLTNGQSFEIQTAFANTSPTVAMNLSTLGNFNCYRSDGTALEVGDIQGPPFAAQFVWNSATSKFLLQNPAVWETLAPRASPALTGNPTAPTQTVNDASTKLATTAFANPSVSKTANGWVELPSGVIIQWGTFVTSNSGFTNWTFPEAFPTGVWSIVGTEIANSPENATVEINLSSATTTTVPIAVVNPGGYTAQNVSLIAIGH